MATTRSQARTEKQSTVVSSNVCFNHQYSNFDINLCQVDILRFNGADCLVNCTGPHFEHPSGVSKQICAKAGEKNLEKKFQKYLAQNPLLNYAEVFVTPAFDLKNYKYIFHISSPHERLPRKSEILMRTIMEILSMAFLNKGLKSIAMPLFGTGNNGIQPDEFLSAFFCALENFINSVGSLKDKRFEINLITITQNVDALDNMIATSIQKRRRENWSSTEEEEEKKAKSVKRTDSEKEEKLDVAGAVVKDEVENCVICMDKVTDEKKLDKCGHKFCKDCIEQHFKSGSQSCPICGTVYGINKGIQPTDATMHLRKINQSLPGYQNCGTLVIDYQVPSGIQGPEHPHPGVPYMGTSRTAYLPDNKEGREILELLHIAFKNRLIFTVGQSRTTNADNVVTWNDIHHKTSMVGGTTCFGYPDPTYLNRVRQELAAKGVVKK